MRRGKVWSHLSATEMTLATSLADLILKHAGKWACLTFSIIKELKVWKRAIVTNPYRA